MPDHLCAGCNEPIGDRFIAYDLPEFTKFSVQEFYIHGKSQFCRECIVAIESGDYDESEYQQ
jgi:hypothetical protein